MKGEAFTRFFDLGRVSSNSASFRATRPKTAPFRKHVSRGNTKSVPGIVVNNAYARGPRAISVSGGGGGREKRWAREGKDARPNLRAFNISAREEGPRVSICHTRTRGTHASSFELGPRDLSSPG